MTATAARYANWKAPAEDGQILIWPPANDLLRQTRENVAMLAAADAVQISGVPLPELRRDLRAWLGYKNQSQPLIATGHQTELYHPGVWVKDILINAIAEKVGGSAVHFSVDTDQPKHLSVRWPGNACPITDDPSIGSAEWSGLLDSPTPAHLRSIEQSLDAASADWKFRPMLSEVLSSLRRSAMEESGLSAAVTNAQHELDWNLGLRHQAMLASPMFTTREYLIFVHHVLSGASRFAVDYNAALADYRREAGISSSTRPMPDLKISADEVEAPFWLDDLRAGSRTRAAVYHRSKTWMLRANGDEFTLESGGDTSADLLGGWLHRHQLRLSPRALTLTTFLRLMVVDQFVHGIGGGRYDQVTDRLLENHFGIQPPRFAVTTATMYFPGAVGQTRVCMPCIVQEGHHLKHSLLGGAKQEVLNTIQRLPRRSVERSLAFHNMHSALATAAVGHPTLRDWADRYHLSREQDKQEQVLFDRELFYAMQSRERLEGMIAEFRRRF